jgi:hypothetical protein
MRPSVSAVMMASPMLESVISSTPAAGAMPPPNGPTRAFVRGLRLSSPDPLRSQMSLNSASSPGNSAGILPIEMMDKSGGGPGIAIDKSPR